MMIQYHCQCLTQLLRYLDTFNKFKVTQTNHYYSSTIYVSREINATSHQQEVSKIDVTVCNASNSRGVNRTTEVGTKIYKMTRTGQLLQEKHPRLTTNQNCAIL